MENQEFDKEDMINFANWCLRVEYGTTIINEEILADFLKKQAVMLAKFYGPEE